jgi:hypothetical protein
MMQHKHKIGVHELEQGDPMSDAVACMVWFAIKGGVRREGESMTIMVPSMVIGPTQETAQEAGEWEIKVTKIED